jgi:phosphatidylinositol alpha-1,6-mannosyltransferase
MRLLVVSQDFPPAIGGIQTYTWELVRRWADRDAHLVVVAPDGDGHADVDASLPAHVTRVGTRPDLLPITGIPAVRTFARRIRADAAFHAQWQTVGASLLSRWSTGYPRRIVCAAHGRELLFNPASDIPLLGSAYDMLRRLVLRGADIFTPVSRYTAGLLEELGVPDDRITIVPNGTDPDRFQPVDTSVLRHELDLEGQPILLTVGRLVPRKGVDTTLRALPGLLETVPDAMYLVVGTGPDRERLDRLAVDIGVRDHVRFAGQVPFAHLPAYYSLADAFVMPSREARPDVEGFGLVFLEAGACGTPVVGARAGGIPDAVQDGTTGLLVPPADPKALADALTRLLTTPELAEHLGRGGRHHAVHEASWDHVADRLWRVLKQTTAAPVAR